MSDDVVAEQGIVVKKYAVVMDSLDHGLMVARNQLILKCFNPLMDAIEPQLKHDHVVNSGTKYKVSILVTAERDASVN